MELSVLFVCTGNVCRSPMAERLFPSRIAGTSPITCSSAGVAALVGRPMDPLSAQVLRELGGTPDGHVARRLREGQVAAADLILTAQASHRAVVLQSEPLAFRRTFTLLEFGRLGGSLGPLTEPVTPESLRARIALVAGQRGMVDPVAPGADDIADPYGQSRKIAMSVGHQVAAAVVAIVNALGLPKGEHGTQPGS